jgi:lipoate-protein ligase A
MLNVLKIPFEKITDKEISAVSERTTTVHLESNTSLTIDEVRNIIFNGYRDAFRLNIRKGDFTKSELNEVHQLEKNKYMDNDWIFQTTDVPDTTGKALVKTPGGLLDIRLVLAGEMIKSVYIRGDFFTSEHAIADLEQSLRWHSSSENTMSGTLSKVYERWSDDLTNLPMDSLLNALSTAIQEAERTSRKGLADPYGCFVTPGGTHA